MRMGVGMTVNDRPIYLRQALNAWSRVIGIENVEFHFGVEPGVQAKENVQAIREFQERNSLDVTIRMNPEKFGAQHNPWEVMTRLFKQGCQYAVLAEDDLLPADDLLLFHKWAAEGGWKGQLRRGPMLVCSFNDGTGTDPAVVHQVNGFANVLVWGTWDYTWLALISRTWDHNYSTGEGLEKGWDHNLDKRVMQPKGLTSLVPEVSRVQNIGVEGTHALGDGGHVVATNYAPNIGWQKYVIGRLAE